MNDRWDNLQRQLTNRAVREAKLNLPAVWLRYFEYTGAADETELEAHMYGLLTLTPMECDVLAHAVNELIDELPDNAGLPRAPYSHERGDLLSD